MLLAAPDLASSYPFMARITRPVLEEERDGTVSFRVTIMEDVPRIDPVRGRVTAFDLGMDSVSVFTVIELDAHGRRPRREDFFTQLPYIELDAHGRRASRIIKPSKQLARMSARRERLLVEKTRLIIALRREIAGDPWSGKAARLRLNLNAVKTRIDNLADAIDWRAAVEMVSWACHSGGVLVLEDLRWSGGGPVKFRHGGVARRVEHVAARLGVRVLYVNPAYSSRTCPSCGTRIPGGCDAARVLSCSKCGHAEDKDSTAAVILAKRGLNTSDGTRVRRPGPRTKRDGTEWPEQHARRADSRMIKSSLERRRRLLAGARWHDDWAASQSSVVTLRGAGSQSCPTRDPRGTIITTSG